MNNGYKMNITNQLLRNKLYKTAISKMFLHQVIHSSRRNFTVTYIDNPTGKI